MMLSLFVSDLDHTLVGDDAGLQILNQQLDHWRHNMGTRIVYSTGRSLQLYRELEAEKNLLVPDALVTAVGTEIYGTDRQVSDQNWAKQISQNWDRDRVVQLASQFPDLSPQPQSEQRPFKVSYFLAQPQANQVIPQLQTQLEAQGLKIQIIYSDGRDLDILPIAANKGLALKFLQQTWQINPAQTVACGDSGNDRALFVDNLAQGIIVGNAKPELCQWYEKNSSPRLYKAKKHCAAGILEGLEHFGYLSPGQVALPSL